MFPAFLLEVWHKSSNCYAIVTQFSVANQYSVACAFGVLLMTFTKNCLYHLVKDVELEVLNFSINVTQYGVRLISITYVSVALLIHDIVCCPYTRAL